MTSSLITSSWSITLLALRRVEKDWNPTRWFGAKRQVPEASVLQRSRCTPVASSSPNWIPRPCGPWMPSVVLFWLRIVPRLSLNFSVPPRIGPSSASAGAAAARHATIAQVFILLPFSKGEVWTTSAISASRPALEARGHVEHRSLERLLELQLARVHHLAPDGERPVTRAEAEILERLVEQVEVEAGQAAFVLVVVEREAIEPAADRPAVGERELPVQAEHRKRRRHLLVLAAGIQGVQADGVLGRVHADSGAELLVLGLEERVADRGAQVREIESRRELRVGREHAVAPLDV